MWLVVYRNLGGFEHRIIAIAKNPTQIEDLIKGTFKHKSVAEIVLYDGPLFGSCKKCSYRRKTGCGSVIPSGGWICWNWREEE